MSSERLKLTEKGKIFIRNQAKSDISTDLLKGKRNFGLPHSSISGKPNNSPEFQAVSYDDIDNNGNLVTTGKLLNTDKKFVEALIKWYEIYATKYVLDANILAAQTYQESKFKTWNYSPTGALGISQFTVSTVFDFILNYSKRNLSGYEGFSQTEINKINNNITGNIKSTTNRVQLHENIMNNPRIMIKAQAFLMRYINNRNQNLASSSLFAYNRGSFLTSKNYPDIIVKTMSSKNFPSGYEEEGVNYVDKIFTILNNNFDYNLSNELDAAAVNGGIFG